MALRGSPLLACAVLILIVGSFLGVAVPAAAHEHVIVGEYELIVGWRQEPAVVGLLNGLDLGIEHHLSNGSTVWVSGADATLNATLTTRTASIVKALEPQFGRPGWYTFDVIPTRPGSYVVRLDGTVEGTAVDKAIVLDDVAPASDVEFPVANPTPPDLQQQVAAMNAQLTLLLALAAVGIILAAAALAMGFVLLQRPRAKT